MSDKPKLDAAVPRVVRHTAAARVCAMESEKLNLQKLDVEISRMKLSIGERITALDRQIADEKASVTSVEKSASALKVSLPTPAL